MRVIGVPIEPLEERYSTQWSRWFKKEMKVLGVEYEEMGGISLTDKIEQGSFLDVFNTNYYKASQLQSIVYALRMQQIRDNDIIFFHDLWFPGIEMLFYIRDAMGLEFKICGCLHAGTYDPFDFLHQQGMERWAVGVETCWFNEVDKIFVATDFHEKLLCNERTIYGEDKVEVTGFPIYSNEIIEASKVDGEMVEKQNIVVFPHRLNSEKQPHLFDDLEKDLKGTMGANGKEWLFMRTKDVCQSKKEYYELLARAKVAVSFAKQETWGIAMQEALFLGCTPLVPDRLSYKEMYPQELRFDKYSTLKEKLSMIMKSSDEDSCFDTVVDRTMRDLSYKGKQAISNMVDVMREL